MGWAATDSRSGTVLVGSLPSETLSCEQTAAILRILIKQIANDMVVIYAPEECGVEAVKELRERISKNHSTLVYIGLQEKLALDLIDKMVASKH